MLLYAFLFLSGIASGHVDEVRLKCLRERNKVYLDFVITCGGP